MNLDLKPMGGAEAALRLTARRGHGDWMVLVLDAGTDAPEAAEQFVAEMEAIGETSVDLVDGAGGPAELAVSLASKSGPVVVCGVDGWSQSEWADFDHLRSRFSRDERTALVLGRVAFETLMKEAPNFSSWLGASVVAYRPDAQVLTEAERQRRLEELRARTGLTDEAVRARAIDGTLPTDPEFAEWLVLLRQGDLLGH